MATSLPSTPKPRSVKVRWSSTSVRTTSPLSRSSQISQRLGGVWLIDIALPPMSPLDWGAWDSVLFAADGVGTAIEAGPDHQHQLDWYNPNANSPSAHDAFSLGLDFAQGTYYAREVASRTVLVNGAVSAQATSLPVDGLDGVGFNAGDWVSFSNGTYNELHKVTADVWPNSSGEATLTIWPPTRRAIADNAAVTYVNPTGEFTLATNTEAASNNTTNGSGQIGGFTLEEFVR